MTSECAFDVFAKGARSVSNGLWVLTLNRNFTFVTLPLGSKVYSPVPMKSPVYSIAIDLLSTIFVILQETLRFNLLSGWMVASKISPSRQISLPSRDLH